jgi:hypothetical protein
MRISSGGEPTRLEGRLEVSVSGVMDLEGKREKCRPSREVRISDEYVRRSRRSGKTKRSGITYSGGTPDATVVRMEVVISSREV